MAPAARMRPAASARGRAHCGLRDKPARSSVISGCGGGAGVRCTGPMRRYPKPCSVLIWTPSTGAKALRSFATQLVSAESLMTRPGQACAINWSLDTRPGAACSRHSNTCFGLRSRARIRPSTRNSMVSACRLALPNRHVSPPGPALAWGSDSGAAPFIWRSIGKKTSSNQLIAKRGHFQGISQGFRDLITRGAD